MALLVLSFLEFIREKRNLEDLDLYLVNMPIDCFFSPSIALGLLKAESNKAGIKTSVLYANLIFARYMGIERYKAFHIYALTMVLFVESLFQPYAGYKSCASLDEIMAFYLKRNPTIGRDLDRYKAFVSEIWEFMDDFLEDIAERIISRNPKAVGCTYTMQQCNANLAILKKIKEKRPDIVTFIGGSASSMHAGAALVNYMDQIDYAFTGESDDVFADAVRLMIARDEEGLRQNHPWVIMPGSTPLSHGLSNMDDAIMPDYDDYFAMLKETGLFGKFQITLPIEGSRGCWWGCKKQCNFCGLNNSPETIAYREKSTERLASELDYLSNRYGLKKFGFTDCILSLNQARQLPALIQDKGYMMFVETKTNMNREELLGLRRAGFIWLQPGLESVHDEILAHINKGNRGIKHIEYLRNCNLLGIGIFWNLLMGFPGEDKRWYYETIDIIPYITHLGLPTSGIFQYQKHSYFTIHARDYGVSLNKETYYPYLFGQDEEFLNDFAEFFYDKDRQMPYEKRLINALNQWAQATIDGADFIYYIQSGFMALIDTRPAAVDKKTVLYGLDKRVCELSDQVIKISKLTNILMAEGYSLSEIEQSLSEMIRRKFIIQMKDELLFLALPRGYEKNNPHIAYYPEYGQ